MLNHSNNITKNQNFLGGSPQISINVISKHVQHAGIIWAFGLLGGISIQADTMVRRLLPEVKGKLIYNVYM